MGKGGWFWNLFGFMSMDGDMVLVNVFKFQSQSILDCTKLLSMDLTLNEIY